jgi:ribonuclease-3
MAAPHPAAASPLEARLGHRFRDSRLLEEALTPPSTGLAAHNQRLEFLGDALLNAAAALLIHREHPDWEEGGMSKLRGMLVCTDSLHRWALDLQLELRTGPRSPQKGRTSGGPRKPLADAVEALLAAAFLDAESANQAGFSLVVRIVNARFSVEIQRAFPGVWEEQDSKTTLQELAAARGWPPPVYALLERSGPDHRPKFRVQAEAGGQSARADSGTIRQAEADAARILLKQLR